MEMNGQLVHPDRFSLIRDRFTEWVVTLAEEPLGDGFPGGSVPEHVPFELYKSLGIKPIWTSVYNI